RALAADPRLLLLDEPMSALDIDVAPALREQLGRFLAERTALIVTHDVLDALTLADRIAVLEDGRLVEHGPAEEVLGRPRTAFAARFAGLNLVTGRWDGAAVAPEGGGRLRARAGFPPGCEVHAAFRPSQVRVVDEGGLARTVRSVVPSGDLVRVRTEDIAADLPAQEVATRRLGTGSPVRLEVPAESVTTYRASASCVHGTARRAGGGRARAPSRSPSARCSSSAAAGSRPPPRSRRCAPPACSPPPPSRAPRRRASASWCGRRASRAPSPAGSVRWPDGGRSARTAPAPWTMRRCAPSCWASRGSARRRRTRSRCTASPGPRSCATSTHAGC